MTTTETEKFERSKRHAFDAYCKKVLRNAARDIYDENRRRLRKESLFSELDPKRLASLRSEDTYFTFEGDVVSCGKCFIVCDETLYYALLELPALRRDIIMLCYFLGLSDKQAGRKLGMARANVQYHRSQALKQLRTIIKLEDPAYD